MKWTWCSMKSRISARLISVALVLAGLLAVSGYIYLALALTSAPAGAAGETLVDQGKPGNYGAWPTSSTGFRHTTTSAICVLCGAAGDGGTLTLTIGGRYAFGVVDQSGSPVSVANGAACLAFGGAGVGEMIQPGTVFDWVVKPPPTGGLDGGTTTYYTCCAQTATASPVGPYLCATPITAP